MTIRAAFSSSVSAESVPETLSDIERVQLNSGVVIGQYMTASALATHVAPSGHKNCPGILQMPQRLGSRTQVPEGQIFEFPRQTSAEAAATSEITRTGRAEKAPHSISFTQDRADFGPHGSRLRIVS